MGKVVTLKVQPPPRGDGEAWRTYVIAEAATEADARTQIDVVTVGDPDANPGAPKTRTVTTTNATLDEGWYFVHWIDGAGNESRPQTFFNGSAVPTPEEIRTRTPGVYWAEWGYGAPEDDAPDPLAAMISEAVAEFQSLTNIDPHAMNGPVAALARKALRMLVTYNASSGTMEILETVADFDLVQSMSGDNYNETRRALVPNKTLIHPWPALAKLLGQITAFGNAGSIDFGSPAISSLDGLYPKPGERIMGGADPRSPFAAPILMPGYPGAGWPWP